MYHLLHRVDNSRSNTGFGVPKPSVFLTYAIKSSEFKLKNYLLQ